MEYENAIAFLSGLSDHERKQPLAKDLTLEPIRSLLKALGNPQNDLRIIHVAGTKGKGSVASMLELMLRKCGYRTGLYTSPDLSGLEERFKVDGAPIASASLAELVGRIQKASSSVNSSGNLRPTVFDVATALAFLYFRQSNVDVAVIEVGMGGRNDSTNVCIPDVSVITSISYDHTKQLGNTLTSIATEKAGIIKAGRPTISGVTAKEALSVIEKICDERGSCLQQLGVHFSFDYLPGKIGRSETTPSKVAIRTQKRKWPWMLMNLLGAHQAANAAVAVATMEELQNRGFRISDSAIADALSEVQCLGRIEVVRKEPLTVLDCAHNIASAEALVSTLQRSFPDYMGYGAKQSRRTLIFGCSRDKDLTGIMTILCPHFERIILTQYARSNRTASKQELLAAYHASFAPATANYVDTACEALSLADAQSDPGDFICISGSIFLAGEIRSLIAAKQP